MSFFSKKIILIIAVLVIALVGSILVVWQLLLEQDQIDIFMLARDETSLHLVIYLEDQIGVWNPDSSCTTCTENRRLFNLRFHAIVSNQNTSQELESDEPDSFHAQTTNSKLILGNPKKGLYEKKLLIWIR